MTKEQLKKAKEIDKELKKLKNLSIIISDYKAVLISAGCGFIKNYYCAFSDVFHKELLKIINLRIKILEEQFKNL